MSESASRLRQGLSPRWRGNRCRVAVVVNALEVYPRAGGATPPRILTIIGSLGLSPRWRGNLSSLRRAMLCVGLSPRWRGNLAYKLPYGHCTGVYPRAGGATADVIEPNGNELGLSPRWRGNPVTALWHFVYPGSIPALAGQPRLGRLVGLLGEEGLSPRWRGNLIRFSCRWRVVRSIPALAGQPFAFRIHKCISWVYPRAGGATSTASA